MRDLSEGFLGFSLKKRLTDDIFAKSLVAETVSISRIERCFQVQADVVIEKVKALGLRRGMSNAKRNRKSLDNRIKYDAQRLNADLPIEMDS